LKKTEEKVKKKGKKNLELEVQFFNVPILAVSTPDKTSSTDNQMIRSSELRELAECSHQTFPAPCKKFTRHTSWRVPCGAKRRLRTYSH